MTTTATTMTTTTIIDKTVISWRNVRRTIG